MTPLPSPARPSDRLAALGWTDRVEALFTSLDIADPEPARVTRVERAGAFVTTATTDERLVHHRSEVAVGDWVALRDGQVAAVVPRWSVLTRADPETSAEQVLAANVDLVVVTAPADRLHESRVERELALAWSSGAQPLVALTKADVAEPQVAEALANRLLGVDLLVTSAREGRGVDALRERLRPNRTAVLLGPSGAGKSTLANALLGEQRLATGEVRAADKRGRHTTTHRQLAVVPSGGVLIDTPGLRSLGLIGDEQLDAVFPDIEEHAARCRFADCGHEVEPGCAVLAAVDAGQLDPARLASYRKLQRELAAEARRTDPLARRADVRVWKSREKALRAELKRKRR